MAATSVFQLARLGLTPGEGRSIDLDVPMDAVEFGGQRYEPEPAVVAARLDADRMSAGWSMRLRLVAGLAGPCTRCLEPARVEVAVDAREIDQPGDDAELASPYVEEGDLDVASWARDAIVLELPAHILCDPDCKGLCAICGENLNRAGADHMHEASIDPRWSKLSELNLE